MCMECYLSTDREIVEIPYDENDPKFYLLKWEKRPEELTMKNVYFCGSWQGCSCGLMEIYEYTDEIIQQMESEYLSGKFSEETLRFWRKQNEHFPINHEEIRKFWEEFRISHRDRELLYRLIEETWNAGFSCEVLIIGMGWVGCTSAEVLDVNQDREKIYMDFSKDFVLYRFLK